ncbi:hypothetical protein KEJ27_08540 [Candidatus Bathyarchaeota archaeon]|nr:hypothetical protein [Candidatus Bathyarchaeota archaeon]
MKKTKPKSLEHYSPDVLQRLPYWVQEMLKLLDEVGLEFEKKAEASKGLTPSQLK